MARYYSDHFHSSGVVSALAGTLPFDAAHRIDAGASSRPRSRAHINIGTAAVIGTELRLFTLPSSARVFDLFCTSDGGSTAGAVDLGVCEAGTLHDGSVLDVNLFATALATNGAIARVDQFTEATTLGNADRGKMLWELVNIGAPATYSGDPGIAMDVVATVTADFTVAVTDLVFECFWT